MGVARDPKKLFTIENIGDAIRAEKARAEPLRLLLAKLADARVGAPEGSQGAAELAEIADVLDAYEAKP